jgi:chemotaxis protein MotA
MEHKKLLGLFVCIIVFASGFAIHGNIGLYFNFAGLLVVLGGTLGATLISFRLERLKNAYKVMRNSSRTKTIQPSEIVEILIDLSVKSKLKGFLSLQEDEKEITVLFLRRALQFLVDGYSGIQIRDILNTEMYFFKRRREESERVLRTMAEICPSFGLVGSVMGLIGMIAGIGDTSVILKAIPIALTSTLYGIIFANFFLLPFAVKIREKTDHELLLQKIIMEGVIAIESELHPRMLEAKLKSFLTPSSRKGRLVSLKRIREKFEIVSEKKTHSHSMRPTIQYSKAQ